MTIGKFGYNPDDGPNPDFICLKKCRETLSKELHLDWQKLDLSMGMSTDYEQAVLKNTFFYNPRRYYISFITGGAREHNGSNWDIYFRR